jgi:flavin-binding protein dodecin
MSDSVFKKVEIVGTSGSSLEDAVANAVAKAAESMTGLSWFEVVEQRGAISDGKVQQYQVTIRIGCKVD